MLQLALTHKTRVAPAVLATMAAAVLLATVPATAEAAYSVTIEDRTLLLAGGAETDTVALRVSASAPHLLQVDLGDDGSVEHELRRSRVDRIRIDGRSGDDAVRLGAAGRFARLEPVRLAGGEGGDALTLEGSDAAERLRIAPRGERVSLSGDGGEVGVALDGLEQLDVAARGGADRLEVEDLSGADLLGIDTGLAAHPGGNGDVDRVSVEGSTEQEQILVSSFGARVFVIGSPVLVLIDHADPSDELRVNGRRWSDLISSSTASMDQTLRGGEDIDVLLGGPGDDVLAGGEDFDDVAGRKGDDIAHLGPDPDRFTRNPGDGNDLVEGGPGHDSMSFNGASVPELFELSADGRRLRFRRDVDAVAIDLDDVEEIDTVAMGGADTITVGDLRRTDVEQVNANLTPLIGSPAGDGAPDRVVVTGTERRDAIAVSGQQRTVAVTGLSALVGISHAEPLDTLAIQTLGGDDSVDSSALAPDTIALTVE